MADSRRIRLIRTAPEIVEPENRRLRLHPEGFRGLRTGASAPWYEGHPPPGVLEKPSDREIGRLTNAYYESTASGILGTVTLFPPGVSEVADRRRSLIGLGSDRVSVQIVPSSRDAESRGDDGALDIWSWTIGHVASVGEPADIGAGDELDSEHPYYNLDIELNWVAEDKDMPDFDLTELATTLPGLISAGIADGFAQHQAAQRAAELAAAEELARAERERELARREADIEAREQALHAEPEPDPAPEPATEEPAPEPASEEPEAADAGEMLARAAAQPHAYDPAKVTALAGDLALGRLGAITADGMAEKLQSIAIQPTRVGPLGSDEPAYDIGRVLRAVIRGDMSEAPYEYSRHQEIARASTVGSTRGKVAIPLNAIDERADWLRAQAAAVPPFQISGGHYDLASNTSGSSSSGRPAVDTPHIMTYRSDIPDPLMVRGLCSTLPGGPGNPEMIRITTPDPAHVAEPAQRGNNGTPVGDVGYAYTGDISAAAASLTPTLMVCRTAVTRLADLQAPDLLGVGGQIIMDKHREIQSETIIVGSGSNRPTGIYDTTGVTSSAELTTAYPTVDETEIAIDNSWRFAGQRRAYVTSLAAVRVLRNAAQPTGVAPYMAAAGNAGSIRDVQVLPTGYWANSGGSGKGEYRGIVGPFATVWVKEWDAAIYVSVREEDGLEILVTELFWNLWMQFPGEFYRFKDDA